MLVSHSTDVGCIDDAQRHFHQQICKRQAFRCVSFSQRIAHVSMDRRESQSHIRNNQTKCSARPDPTAGLSSSRKVMEMKTVAVSVGIVTVLCEALLVAANRLDELQRQRKRGQRDPMYDVRARFYRNLQQELRRALEDRAEYPGYVCCNYEAGQKWH
jgi:hypothetical protein